MGGLEGDLNIAYSYRIVGIDPDLSESWGEEVWRVEAKALSKLGEASLSAWYSETLGLRRMIFTLPNGDSLEFNLTDDVVLDESFTSVEEFLYSEKSFRE